MYRLEMVVISGRQDFNKTLPYKFDGQSKFMYPNNARTNPVLLGYFGLEMYDRKRLVEFVYFQVGKMP